MNARNPGRLRTALALRAFGVIEFAMTNVKDFEGFGFEKVGNSAMS
jgi:hypothetical protein